MGELDRDAVEVSSEALGGPGRFKSARRVFEVLEVVSLNEGVTAKALSRELGVSLSTCYHLINVLLERGYLERVPRRRGYRLGPAIPLLYGRLRGGRETEGEVEPVLEEVAESTGRHAYFGVFRDGEVTVTRVVTPPESPPVGVVEGFHGASHALALGKVLLAGSGTAAVRAYVRDHGLEAFTRRTITSPRVFESHLAGVAGQRFATDVQEFAENLCCVAAPVEDAGGTVRGAVGLSSSARRFESEARSLLSAARWAAGEASAILRGETATLRGEPT